MGELWFAEAVIPKDRVPDWAAAHAYLDTLSASDIDAACPHYVDEIEPRTLAAAGIDPAVVHGSRPLVAPPQLAPLVISLLHRDLDQVALELTQPGRCLGCFATGDLKVFVYFSGYG